MATDDEIKPGIEAQPDSTAEHHELGRDPNSKAHNDVVLKSKLDELGWWATVKRFKKAVLICNLISIAAAADGYQYTMNGNIIANQGFINHLGFPDGDGKIVLNSNYTSLWGAMQSLGQLLGMVLLSPVSDRIGRKMTMYILWLLLAVSIAIESTVHNWRDWSGAKLLVGIGVGALQSTLPIYVTEWSPANIRGSMVLGYGFWNSIGKFFAPLFLTIIEDTKPLDYKIAILTQWAFVGIMLPIFLWLPETPAYYAARDQDEKGKATLRRVNGNVDGFDVEIEYAIIKNTVLEEQYRQRELGIQDQSFREMLDSYVECFRGPNARRTLGAALPACTQQLTGLAFLNVYASLFFKQSGFQDAFLITTILAVIALVSAIVLILTTDKFGRRRVVFACSVVCTVAMLIIAGLAYAPKTTPLGNFLIFVACVWTFFSSGLGILGWAFVGEVSSQKLRARTAGLAAGASVIFGLTFNTAVPKMLDTQGANWGYKTGFLFFATGAVSCLLVFLYVPEPSLRNAAELDEMYEKGVPPWKMKKYDTDVQRLQKEEQDTGVV
ncbi:sugar transporter [Niveomyces insectorum RCEF 264]|uniref:Sugar transporter n=1 Tax=Niveomyces insectorum RCEF 264 TaxID=1081102 RepID=A0A167P3V2_9HYPO|nr:sugar transporter [Niveomyces insectorum RCEF 264]